MAAKWMSKKLRTMKNAPARGDEKLREFSRRGLGDGVRTGSKAVVTSPQRPTSILLADDLIAKLREKARRKGIGYQTLMKMIVREHIDEY